VVRKGVAVWVLGSLTFLAGLHSLDSFLWLTGVETEPFLLFFYPFSSLFDGIDPVIYLICAVLATFLLWGGTTVIAMRSPIETFLGKVLEDGKKENQAEVEFLEAKTSILEMMSETLANNSKSLASLRDVTFGVRSEVLRLQSMYKNVEGLGADVEEIKKIMKELEKEIQNHKMCPACGRDVLTEFRLCPYCGENLLKPLTNSREPLLATRPVIPRERGRKVNQFMT